MKTVFHIGAAAVGAAVAMGPAGAAPPATEQNSAIEVIRFADLNLGSTAGQVRLRHRIGAAAYRLCLVDGPASPSPLTADPVCFRAAVERGLQQMQMAVARASNSQASAALATADATAR